MFSRATRGRRWSRPRATSDTLQDSLLNAEERAMLYELDQTFLVDEEEEGEAMRDCRDCLRSCTHFLTDKGIVSLIVTLVITLVGVALLVVFDELDLPTEVGEFAQYVISAGVFGLASGGTNWIAVVMLFYKIPFLVGSGVFYRRHKQIIGVIKLIVLQMLFDSKHLESYLQRKIRQFTSNVPVVDTIIQALNSPETERVIDRRLAALYTQPEAYFLEVLGLSQERVRPMIKPAVLSLCAETAPIVLETVSDEGQHQAISVPRFRAELDRYLSWRIEQLAERKVGKQLRRLMYRHMGWVVVWGSVFGMIIGIATQALKFSLNFNFA